MAETLKILPKSQGIPAPRGAFLRADAIAKDLFNGVVSEAWVRRNVPGKVKLGHSTVAWFEADVLAFIESRKQESSAA